ncbi:MAG: glycoside hydrolase family 2 protein [Armatimonadota bacterium]
MQLNELPKGYNLQVCDECGTPAHQPHVTTGTCHTMGKHLVDADDKARTVVGGTPDVEMVYDNLDPAVPYVLAVTYATEKVVRRAQSLAAGSVTLHEAHTLPEGKSEKLLFEIPSEAFENGRLTLRFVRNEGPNAVVSLVELWAPLPTPDVFHLHAIPSATGVIAGTMTNVACDGIPDVEILARNPISGKVYATTLTGADGTFRIDMSELIEPDSNGEVEVLARSEGKEALTTLPFSELTFVVPQFVPVAVEVAGVQSSVIKLDGVWNLNTWPADNFYDEFPSEPGWSDFTVPGQFLQQGFNIPQDKHVAVVTETHVPDTWAGMRLFLRFDAIHGGIDYWLNGHHLGYSENLYTPVEFDVTEAVRLGEMNYLALSMKVDTTSEMLSYMSVYAYHNLGGIDRSVSLFALPSVHLSRLHHEATLDADYRNGILSVDLGVENPTERSISGLSVRFSLEGPTGEQIALADDEFSLDVAQPGETSLCRQFEIADPLKWNAEKPHLYQLHAAIYQDGVLLERVQQSVGFRKVEVRDSQLWVNGVRVKLAGTCRHELDPLTGRADTVRHAEEDVRLLKEANFNYIRVVHYPPTREFLDACDRVGIYVTMDAPFCWTREGRGESDPARTKHFLTPVAAMIDYHRDHPSVIVWSIGNESGVVPSGENRLPLNFTEVLRFCRDHNPTRLTVFNNEWAKDGGACDMAVLHYVDPPEEEFECVKDDPRPILLDECYMPMAYAYEESDRIDPGHWLEWSRGQNSPDSRWNHVYASNRIVGGAIWAGIDDQFYFEDGRVKGFGPWGLVEPQGKTKGMGAWGFLDAWRRKKSHYWDAKLIHSPVWIPVRHIDYTPGQDVVRVPVENRYSFTNLSELRVLWEVGSEKSECKVELPPLQTGDIRIPIFSGVPEGSQLVLRFMDVDDNLITTHAITLGRPQLPKLPDTYAGCPRWRESGRFIEVSDKDLHIMLDRSTGVINQHGSDDPMRLLSFPILHIARREERCIFYPDAPTYAEFPVDGTRVVQSVAAKGQGDALTIAIRDHYQDYEGCVEMCLDKTGQGTVHFDYEYSGDTFKIGELGLRFLLDSRCREILWWRKTEWDVYPEDHIGRAQGRAAAQRGREWGTDPLPWNARPAWPWSLDENDLGTRDFRATKHNICEASLIGPDGSGLQTISDGSTDVRACLAEDSVMFHIMLSDPPTELKSGDRISGTFWVRFFPSLLSTKGEIDKC